MPAFNVVYRDQNHQLSQIVNSHNCVEDDAKYSDYIHRVIEEGKYVSKTPNCFRFNCQNIESNDIIRNTKHMINVILP